MRWSKTIVIGLLTAIIALSTYKILPDLASQQNTLKETEHIQQLIKTNSDDSFSHQSWNALKEENNDFIGYLKFESGLIETPVVQGRDNDEYLQKSFEGKYDTQGAPFMDAMASPYSTNITIYGHNVYYDSNAKFSPLERLTDDESAKVNRKVKFYLKDKCREYEVVAVLYITSEEAEEMDYSQSAFVTARQKSEWMSFMMRKSLINGERESSPYDNFLTLQTCRKWNENEHLLVICREVRRHSY